MANKTIDAVIPYEKRLDSDWRLALSEGSRFFEGGSAVQDALLTITKKLDALGVPYAVAGGMALFQHGFHRFTDDVDLLVTREGLNLIHEKLEGLGYLQPFSGSKQLRDTEHGVRIKFLITGGYPGDGKPKPVAFPDPSQVVIERDGIKFLNLPTLVELKLASGMTGGIHRGKDLVDVVELIKRLNLPNEFANQLNPFVRERFLDLWNELHSGPRDPFEEQEK
jgi:hypothetical protein